MAAITPFVDRTEKTEDTGTDPSQCPVGTFIEEPPGGPLPTIGDLLGDGVGSPCLGGGCPPLGNADDLVPGAGPPRLGDLSAASKQQYYNVDVIDAASGDLYTYEVKAVSGAQAIMKAVRKHGTPVRWAGNERIATAHYSGFGVVQDVPAIEKSHAELTRTVWIRRALEEQLLTGGRNGGARDYWIEADCKTGEFFFHLSPAMEKDILPWYVGVKDTPRFSLFGSNGKMLCVASGTLVPVRGQGLLPIERIHGGEHVLTRNGWKKVTAAQQTGVRATLEIVAESGQRVRVTPDHQIAAKPGWPKGYKPHPRKRGTLGWVRADELTPGMFVLPAPEGFAAVGAEVAGAESDHEVGVLIGYVVGDGTFAANGRIAIDVGDTKRNDLDVIADIAKRHFGAEPHRGEYSGARGTKPKFKSNTTNRLYWENDKLTAFFAECGLKHGVKSPLRRAPASLFNGPRRAILGFLSGLFSADGSIGRDVQAKVRAELDTTSAGLALDVQRLFLALGARVSISQHKPGMPALAAKPIHRVNVRSARALDVLAAANLVNEAKRKALGLCSDLPRNEKGVRLTRVERVNNDGLVVPVYDLTVEDDHEFVAGGLVVHNCPTWDLPAGAPSIGGACPGATAAQTVVDPALRKKALAIIGEIDEPRTICQSCVTGDTRVLVRGRGLVPIAELVEEGEIEVWSGKAWRATKAIATGVKPTFNLRTSWGAELRCTGDHKILTKHNGMVEAQDLVEDRLVYEPPTNDGTPFPPEAALPFVVEHGKEYQTSVEAHFPRDWSFDVGLVLGYVLGDGCISGDKYPQVVIGIGEEDRSDLDRLEQIVKGWCETETSVRVHDVAPSGFVETGNQRRVSLNWRVKSLVEFLQGLGLNKRAAPEDRRVPHSIWTATVEGVRGFLSGLFSTDGSVLVGASKVEVTLASVSRGLLQDVQQLLFALGIKSTICAYVTSNAWRTEQGYRSLYKLNVSAFADVVRFQERVGFWNERKSRRLDAALPLDARTRVRHTFPRIAAVEPTGKVEPVFDLVNVGEEHQFTANGVTVSNCYALEGNYPSPHVQVGELLRYWWSRSMLAEGKGEEWVETMVHAIAALNIPRSRQGIRPIRVHSSGDFFSPNYAAAWMEVANRVWDLEVAHGRSSPEIRFWAPTRTWAAGFDWSKISARLAQPNMIVRPSAYHVDDTAPGPLVPGWAAGTTSIINRNNGGMAPEFTNVLKGNFAKVEAGRTRGPEGHDARFDWSCQTYAIDIHAKGKDLSHSCEDAIAPDGKIGCRMCWTHPQLRVNYTTH